MRIIGHHTCDAKGEIQDIAVIEAQGAFLSIHTNETPKMLGTGYYFFDNNLSIAHAHGKNRYKRQYHIFEAEIQLTEDVFLDLVGNRIDMLWLQALRERLTPFLAEGEINWKVGHLIEFLKQKGLFPYKAIRVLDSSLKPEQIKEAYKIYYFTNKEKFLNIHPIFTICLLELNPQMIRSFHYKTSNPS